MTASRNIGPHTILRDLREATEAMTKEEENAFLWSVVETVYPPIDRGVRWWMIYPEMRRLDTRALDLLYRRRGEVVTVDALRMAVWGRNESVKDVRVRQVISSLRTFLIEGRDPFEILTVKGGGYTLRLDPSRWPPPEFPPGRFDDL